LLFGTISQSILLSHGNRSGPYPGKNRGLERGVSCVVVVPRRRYSATELVLANMSEKMRMKTNTMLRCLTSRFTSIRIPSPRKNIWSSKGKAYVRGSSSGSKGNMKGSKILKNYLPGSKLSLSLIGCKERVIPPLHRRSFPLRWKRTTRCFDSL